MTPVFGRWFRRGPPAKGRKRRPRWDPGRLFALPLEGGGFGLCQTLSSLTPNIVDCAVFDARYDEAPLGLTEIGELHTVAVLSTWKREINKGRWPRAGEAEFALNPRKSANYRLWQGDAIGHKTYDAGIIEYLVPAFHGQVPWNAWHDPLYFDDLLLSGRRPAQAVILSQDELERWKEAERRG